MDASDFYGPIPTRATKVAIQEATEQFAEAKGLEPGFPIEKLVQEEGGRLEFREPIGLSQSSESIRVYNENKFVIYLATDTSSRRDRFTIAHELGHFFLHYPNVLEEHGADAKMVATRFVNKEDEDLVRAEWEANWFAASLLMPKKPFERHWRKTKGNISTMADIFNVTTKAIEIRAASLGLPSD